MPQVESERSRADVPNARDVQGVKYFRRRKYTFAGDASAKFSPPAPDGPPITPLAARTTTTGEDGEPSGFLH